MPDQSIVISDIQAVVAATAVYTAANDQAKADKAAIGPLQSAVDGAKAALDAGVAVAATSEKSAGDAWANVLAGLAKAEADATSTNNVFAPMAG